MHLLQSLLKTLLFLFGVVGEKDVRKITTMKSIWGRQNKPKLKLEINEIGQPIGTSAHVLLTLLAHK